MRRAVPFSAVLSFRSLSPRRGAEVILAVGLGVVVVAGIVGMSSGADPTQAQGSAQRPLSDPAVFARFDPFFRQGEAPALLDLTAEGWLLFGTRTGANGTAILQGPDGTQAAYGIGDTVAPDLVLASVAPDHVMLDRGGRTLRLEFSDISIPAPPPPPEGVPSNLSGDAAMAAAEMGLTPPPADAYVAGLRPLSREGRIEGYVWRRGAQIPALSAVGLREGDVVTAVNGEALTRDERVEELGQTLGTGSPVTLTVRRGGQTLNVTINPPSE